MSRRNPSDTIVLAVHWVVGIGLFGLLVWVAQNYR